MRILKVVILVKPEKLFQNDKVGIFLPSSPIKQEYRLKGLAEIRDMGFIPLEVDNISADSGYTGKPEDEIVRDLEELMRDDSVKALWAARGGYGSNLILDKIDHIAEMKPKIIIGSSDVSFLLWRIMSLMNMPVFYGPMAFSAISEKKYDRENLITVLNGDYTELKIGGEVLRKGKSENIVTGGCLSNLTSLCGTRFFPETEGRIVLLEDINERPFRLDRMMWQLSETGFFSGIKGILFGEFPGCFKDEKEKNMFYSSIKKYFDPFDYPVLYDMPFGHSSFTKTLPLGIKIKIDTSDFNGIILSEKGVI